MAGFLSPPSLGFATGIGAFVGGVARGVNEEILAQQDAQEKERIAKFNASKAAWAKDQQQLKKSNLAASYFADVYGQGTQQYKSAMQLFNMGVKVPDIVANISVPNTGSSSSTNPGQEAPDKGNRLTMSEMTQMARDAGFDEKTAPIAAAIGMAESGGNPGNIAVNDGGKGYNSYGVMQINGSHPNAQAALDPREGFKQAYTISNGGTDFSPWSTYNKGTYKQYLTPPSTSSAPVAPTISTQPSPDQSQGQTSDTSNNPYYMPSPKGYADGGQVDPNEAAYIMSGGQQQQPTLMPEQQQAQSAIPQQSSQQQPQQNSDYNTSSVMSDADQNMPQANMQYAQYVPGTIIPGGASKPVTQYQQHEITNQDRNFDFNKYKFEQEQEAKRQQEANRFNPAQTEFSKTIFDESSKGTFTGANKQVLQSTVTDANSALNMLSDGTLKTSQLQPIADAANRLFSSVGIDVLANSGLANDVSTMNYLNKVVSREQFGEIAKYHLGRWTQMEVAMLARQVASGQSDFNTNAKILLLNRGAAQEQLNYINAVRQAAKHGDKEDINAAMDAANNFKPNEGSLWAQVNGTNPEETAKAIMQMKPQTWIEDKSNHKMYYLQGIQNGQINLMSDHGKIALPAPPIGNP